MGKGRKMGSIR
jgi:hypothetical protein